MITGAEAFAAFLLQEEPWRDSAACRSADPGLFFPKRGQSKRAAMAYCNVCPVIDECREYAERTNSEYGIWGAELRTPRKDRDVPAAATPDPPDTTHIDIHPELLPIPDYPPEIPKIPVMVGQGWVVWGIDETAAAG